MTAPHFFVESLAEGVGRLSLQDSRHALRSLRLSAGEEVTLADGRGAVARGRLAGEEDGLALIEVGSIERASRPAPSVEVALSPPKGDRLSWAIQKLGELGVDETCLVTSDRSVRIRPSQERLRAIAREAAMQSRRPFVMEVSYGGPLRDAMAGGTGQAIVLWEGADTPLGSALTPDARSLRLVVGPEGGLSDREIQAARSAGARLASLGPGILRTETAAIVGAALVLAHYGRLG